MIINLPQLRPYPEWRSDDYDEDVVLMVRPDADDDEIRVTYTATAREYGDVYRGEATSLPVERLEMKDVLRAVARAHKDS